MYSISVRVCTHNARVRRRKEQTADKNDPSKRAISPPPATSSRAAARRNHLLFELSPFLPPPLAPLSEHAASNVDKYHQLNIEITPGARTLLARISAQQLVIAAAKMGVLLSPVHISHPQDTDNVYFFGKTDLLSIYLKLLYGRLDI